MTPQTYTHLDGILKKELTYTMLRFLDDFTKNRIIEVMLEVHNAAVDKCAKTAIADVSTADEGTSCCIVKSDSILKNKLQ